MVLHLVIFILYNNKEIINIGKKKVNNRSKTVKGCYAKRGTTEHNSIIWENPYLSLFGHRILSLNKKLKRTTTLVDHWTWRNHDIQTMQLPHLRVEKASIWSVATTRKEQFANKFLSEHSQLFLPSHQSNYKILHPKLVHITFFFFNATVII